MCGAHCMPFSLRGERDVLDTQGYSMDSSHARLLQTVVTPKSQIASGPGLHHTKPCLSVTGIFLTTHASHSSGFSSTGADKMLPALCL